MDHGKRGEPGEMRSMTGQEVADMFGNHELLKLEEEHKRFETELHELSQKIATAKEDSEADWETVDILETTFHEVLAKMRKYDVTIRKMGMDFATKRGPVPKK